MNKYIIFITLALISSLMFSQNITEGLKKMEEIEQQAEKLAQEQLDAYNNRDIEKFLIPFSDSVEVYIFPDELIYIGKEKMRTRYGEMFAKTPDLHCKLTNRTVLGNKVIDSEEVVGMLPDKIVKAVAIYTIENNKIQKVHFIKQN